MSGIFGHLNLSDSDRVFNNTAGQAVVWDAVQAYLARVNADLQSAMRVFVSGNTESFKERYKLAGGGTLQKRGSDGRYAAVKALGQWDVAYPLEDYGAAVVGNDVDMAYMTVRELDRHVQTVVTQNVNTMRWAILHRLFDNVAETFIDSLNGSLTIQPLANGNSVVYPPVIGSETEATEQHYANAGYLASAISDTNNPFPGIAAELNEHFGVEQGGSNVATFFNHAQIAAIEALTGFDKVPDRFIRTSQLADIPINLPSVPGVVKGRIDGCWVIEWDWIPATYTLATHLDAEAPLKLRVDPADTGLGAGLQLVATDEEFPFRGSIWRNRFGVGTANRLNGYVLEITDDGAYTVPTAYD